jgi:hypothetical protein
LHCSFLVSQERIPAIYPLRRIRKLAGHALDWLNPTLVQVIANNMIRMGNLLRPLEAMA